MKKIFLSLLLVLCVTGCGNEVKGDYKEGTYMGYDYYSDSYGNNYVTTAVIYVDNSGLIKSCYIDETYNKDDKNTTKKVLGDDYGMKETSANIGVISGGAEWYEQIKVIEDKVVSEQNLDWVKWQSEDTTKLDSISGVTISADSYINALKDALEDAK